MLPMVTATDLMLIIGAISMVIGAFWTLALWAGRQWELSSA